MTKNRRYEAHYDGLNDARIAQAAATLAPTTLPMQAYGPAEIEWKRPGVPVWAWISWTDAPATRIAAEATGWNDRVVCVEWEARGGRRSVMVWRNAVTRRS
ncbi:hypothetical protein BKA24_001724 [Microbacterium marinum]|uniref:Uncharacterized protein n=1 Tax=Microbacterium marinum TaxID=421115 RepID=A0A7W7BQJ8_9MICO|nr:hypothetical protein [Microbacterium marinum]MBB4667015.1 hypothetical protein [Microbacterium marinum]